MINNYIIISSDKVSIDSSIKNIIKKIKIKDLEIIKYDYQEVKIDNVLEELNTYNLLSNCKFVIYYNCSFLADGNDKSIKSLNEYFEHTGDNYLVLINDSLSEKKEIKELISGCQLITDEISSESIIKDNLEEYTMDNQTINYFCEYCLNNKEKMLNELSKIKNYKYDSENKNITIEDINNIVNKDYDDNIFDLVNAITRNNKNKAFELFYRLCQKEKDSLYITASVASSIRNLYSVKVLTEQNYKQNEISNCLGIKPYAVSKLIENCHNYSSKKLLRLLDTLAELDYKSKSGNGQSNILFEMFLLSL